MYDFLRQIKDNGDCNMFIYLEIYYIPLNRLIKMDIDWYIDMSFSNKFLNREKGRNEIVRFMNYYIDNNNIAYVDSIEKENDDKASDI